jgi:hypothetical protein
MLELQKKIDQLAATSAEPEKREPPKEERKPKTPSRKP